MVSILSLLAAALAVGIIVVPAAGASLLLLRQILGTAGLITAATNTSPAVLTSTNHGLPNGALVTISGAGGNTAINGTFLTTNVTANTFQLAILSGLTLTPVNGNGVLSGQPYWTAGFAEGFTIKLFSSNTTPSEADTAATYTELPSGNGYTSGGQALSPLVQTGSQNGWTLPAFVGGGGNSGWAQALGTGSNEVAEISYSPITWNWTGPATVYGYYIIGTATGSLYWAERFVSPQLFAAGDSLTIVPSLGLTHS